LEEISMVFCYGIKTPCNRSTFLAPLHIARSRTSPVPLDTAAMAA